MAKAARSHHCHAAFQLVVRLDRHRVARHHLAHRSLLRVEPGQQHFYGAVTLGHDTDQYVVVDDQHRPDPVVTHLAQGFDDHVAGTNMDQGTTLLGQGVFDCVHRAPLVSPVLARLSGYALKVRAGSFSIDHNLAHHAAINRGAGLVRVASSSTARWIATVTSCVAERAWFRSGRSLLSNNSTASLLSAATTKGCSYLP